MSWVPPWTFGTPPPQQELTGHALLLHRLRFGVPCELACRAAGTAWADIKDDPEVIKAQAEGEILLFERARDSGVTGIVRAALRNETKSWVPKAETSSGQTLEDLLRD